MIADFSSLNNVGDSEVVPINTRKSAPLLITCSVKFVKEEKSCQVRYWETEAVSYKHYCKGFKLVQQHIHNGDTYLLNYTQPTKVKTNLSLRQIFDCSIAIRPHSGRLWIITGSRECEWTDRSDPSGGSNRCP